MLLQSLRDFIHEDLMFGPLKFQDGVTGKPLGQVPSMASARRLPAVRPSLLAEFRPVLLRATERRCSSSGGRWPTSPS